MSEVPLYPPPHVLQHLRRPSCLGLRFVRVWVLSFSVQCSVFEVKGLGFGFWGVRPVCLARATPPTPPHSLYSDLAESRRELSD